MERKKRTDLDKIAICKILFIRTVQIPSSIIIQAVCHSIVTWYLFSNKHPTIGGSSNNNQSQYMYRPGFTLKNSLA